MKHLCGRCLNPIESHKLRSVSLHRRIVPNEDLRDNRLLCLMPVGLHLRSTIDTQVEGAVFLHDIPKEKHSPIKSENFEPKDEICRISRQELENHEMFFIHKEAHVTFRVCNECGYPVSQHK